MAFFVLFRGILNVFLTTTTCPSLNGLCNKMAIETKDLKQYSLKI